jgi:adenosyl cobinamide kinase/adenosyl cobinamide phosphate guanylyltransferase
VSGLLLLTGGARSGKSALALRAARSSGLPVVFVATGWADDAEMERRIARHRAERPPGWEVIEERVDLAGALRDAPVGSCAIVDCLSLWVANLMREGIEEGEIEDRAAQAAELAVARSGPVIAVTNEVGLGVVPASASGRAFRDALGRVNALWAQRSARAALVVAGRALPLLDAGWLVAGMRG